MFQEFTIEGRFCGLNEFYRAHHHAQAKMKAEAEARVIDAARAAGLKPCKGRVFYRVTWYEQNRRRDLDNVAFGKKFIQDGLVKAGILENDSAAYIAGFSDHFAYDSERPRVVVSIVDA